MRSIRALLLGTFTLRLSTSLTGTMLAYYLAEMPKHGGSEVQPIEFGLLATSFYVAELVLGPPFGALSDRLGHHRVMQWGPAFGFVAVVLTWASTHLVVLGGTRLLEGASTAASVPSILGFIAAATALDVAARGRTVARFEAATLAGIGAGIVLAGPLFQVFGRAGFLMNAVVYVFSFFVYRRGVAEAPSAEHQVPPGHYGLRRYWTVLTSSHVWLLAPTWIAINACVGIVTTQTLFLLVRVRPDRFADQMLMGVATPVLVSVGLSVGGLVFLAGLLYSGARFAHLRRTTIIFEGVLGGLVIAVASGIANHSQGFPVAAHGALALLVLGGVFGLAGATPAALGLLADITETYPTDRGAIMGLYSVFLALGQIVGSLVGGGAAQIDGVDGLVVAALVLLAVAVVPLYRLRDFEHAVGTVAEGHGPRTTERTGGDEEAARGGATEA